MMYDTRAYTPDGSGHGTGQASNDKELVLQPYDSTIYTDEPEALPAQWGFVWSTDPYKALPFIELATSPYMMGDCASEGGMVYRSTIDSNVWAPSGYPQGWTELGPVGGPFVEEDA